MSRLFLAMNGKRINSLDDLRLNFNPEQMLSFYRSGRLQKWLEELNANDELEAINGFEPDYDDGTLLSMLMAVFELNDEQIVKVNGLMNNQVDEPEPIKDGEIKDAEEPKEDGSSQWLLCQLPSEIDGIEELLNDLNSNYANDADNKGTALASSFEFASTFETVKANRLEEQKVLVGPKSRNVLKSVFSFGKHLWGIFEHDAKNFVAKSEDGVHWVFDGQLTKLLLLYGHLSSSIKVISGDEHCFLFFDYYENYILTYSEKDDWSKIEIDIDGMVGADKGIGRTHSIFEQNGYVGILREYSYETGIIFRDWHHEYRLFISSDFFNKTKSFKIIDSNWYDVHNCSCCAFKGQTFVSTRGILDEKGRLWYGEFDERYLKKEITNVDCEQKDAPYELYPFKDILFIGKIKINYSDIVEADKVYYTSTGTEWHPSDLGDKVRNILQVQDKYVAIKADHDNDLTICCSQTGNHWECIQNIKCKYEDSSRYVVSVTAIGNTLVLCNGTESGKYLLCRFESK